MKSIFIWLFLIHNGALTDISLVYFLYRAYVQKIIFFSKNIPKFTKLAPL